MVLAVNEVVVVGWLLLGWLLPLGFQTFVAPSLSLRLSRSSGLCDQLCSFLRSAALEAPRRVAPVASSLLDRQQLSIKTNHIIRRIPQHPSTPVA